MHTPKQHAPGTDLTATEAQKWTEPAAFALIFASGSCSSLSSSGTDGRRCT